MSMTKRYLESLPEDEQNAILGRHDEWADEAENEPSAEEFSEWARALMEEHGIDPDHEAWWSEREAREADCRIIRPPTGADDYPDYGDLDAPWQQ